MVWQRQNESISQPNLSCTLKSLAVLSVKFMRERFEMQEADVFASHSRPSARRAMMRLVRFFVFEKRVSSILFFKREP